MKKILATVLAAALIGGVVNAQEIPDRKPDGVHRMAGKGHRHQGFDMQKLNLTEDQKTKVKALNDDFKKQMQDLKKQDNITVKESRTRMESLRKEHRAKTENILTAEQKAQLKTMKTDRKAEVGERGKDRLEKMKAELSLTDQQVAKLKASHEAMGVKTKAIRENASLTDDAKKDQMKEVFKKQKEDMKSILTEEQLKKMEENRKNHHRGSKKQSV
jgi:Spy/CpxP family protein refolding chaperone